MTELAERLAKLTPAQRALLDRRLAHAQAERAPAAPDRIPARARRDRARLTVDQERIWLIHQFDPSDPVYNVFFGLRLSGDLDTRALERAVDAVVSRHEALRTTFEFDQEHARPVQIVHESMPIAVRPQDLTHLPPADREAEMQAWALDEIRQPFDLAAGPLLRVTLLRLDTSEHVLVGTVDHLVWDRASVGTFERELAECYAAFATGWEPQLPALEIQYADYAEWQPTWLAEEVRRRHLPYWRDRLAGAPLVLELPTDKPRPPVQTFNGARYQFRVTPELTRSIRELARREGVTVNVALLAAWYLLLHRYTGADDIIVATTSSTRSRPETEPIIGYFLTMLPLRTAVRPDMTFRELLAAARATMIGAFDHHDIPFGTLLDELDVARDPSRTPVYQTTFILVDFREDELAMPGLRVRPIWFDNGTAKDEVTVGFFDEEQVKDHLYGLFEYNTDLFTEATIARMWAHLRRLLEQVVTNPGRRLRDLSLLEPGEEEALRIRWNRTAVPRAPDIDVTELIRRRAAATPNAVAVSCGPARLTYAELIGRAERLAGCLQRRGVGPETVVGVCLERSSDLMVTLLGVLAAGGAYLPMDPRFPPDRLAAMAADAQAALVVTQRDLAGRVTCPLLCLDSDAEEITVASPPEPMPADADRLAYVIYTSGSTGRPKGVEVTHGNLVNLLLAMADEVGLTAADVLPAVTSVSFDIAGLELFGPLVAGGHCVVVPGTVAQDPHALAALLADTGATVMQATPTTWHLLVDAGWRNDTGVRVIVGGEALPPTLAAALTSRSEKVWNVYGPTETTVWSTTARVDGGTEQVTIGRPLANTEAYVLDEAMAPVPVGMAGELYLGGLGVARGYRGRPDLTAARFLPDHLGPRPGGRLYRTGDTVRRRADGALVFLGRNDGQVKLRGHRIELGEIEARLAERPGVGRAVAMLREDRPGDRRLVAYVEAAAEAVGDLAEPLRAALPEYMVPSAFVRLDRFPLTASGKIDRNALPAPSAERRAADYMAPRDPVELRVARIWEDVLGTRPVGVHDGFFDLGGHSLLVLRLMTEIERRFGRQLPVAAIFQGATVERFARMLRQGYRPDTGPHLVPIRPGAARKSPVFFAHPAGSEVVCYMPFADLVQPADRPLYAIGSGPPVDGALPYDGFAERAAAYSTLIRETQPTGPYLLAGWCYGGANAFAIGRELERTGDRVTVVLIDAHAPEPPPAGTEPDRGDIVAGLALNLQWNYPGDMRDLDRLRRMTADEHLDYLLVLARQGDYLPPDAGRAQMSEVLELWTANLRLLWRYRPAPFAGDLVLIQASDEEPGPYRAWRELADGGLSVRQVTGNHYSIMRPPWVRAVAAVISEIAGRHDA